jgi:hypothetical protein
VLFLVHRFLSPWWRRLQVPPKRRFIQEPHGVTTQTTPFFTTTIFWRRLTPDWTSLRHSRTWSPESKSVMLRSTASRQVGLGVRLPLGPMPRFLLLSDSCTFDDVERPFWRKNLSVVYNSCWSLSQQSFLGPNHWLKIIFYCLTFNTLPTWMVRFLCLHSPGMWWPSYTPRHWDTFPFPHPSSCQQFFPLIPLSTDSHKTPFTIVIAAAIG